MELKEDLIAHEYKIVEISKSRIDPTKKVRRNAGYRCPRCDKRLHAIEHGKTTHCHCGLILSVYENAIYGYSTNA
jgi:hypothetical protein